MLMVRNESAGEWFMVTHGNILEKNEENNLFSHRNWRADGEVESSSSTKTSIVQYFLVNSNYKFGLL